MLRIYSRHGLLINDDVIACYGPLRALTQHAFYSQVCGGLKVEYRYNIMQFLFHIHSAERPLLDWIGNSPIRCSFMSRSEVVV